MLIKNAMEYFNVLNNVIKGVYPVKMSFALSTNYDALAEEMTKIEKERKRLCEEYAEKDEDGKAIINEEARCYEMTDENKASMNKEYDELMEQEVFPAIRKIKEEDIEKCESDSRYTIPSANEIRTLAFMIE